LNTLHDAPFVINVRLAGYACCSTDHEESDDYGRPVDSSRRASEVVMTGIMVLGLGQIAAGLRMIYRRRKIAADSAARHESWLASRPDVDLLEARLGVLGWILVVLGIATFAAGAFYR
jgi:hypothetical protein